MEGAARRDSSAGADADDVGIEVAAAARAGTAGGRAGAMIAHAVLLPILRLGGAAVAPLGVAGDVIAIGGSIARGRSAKIPGPAHLPGRIRVTAHLAGTCAGSGSVAAVSRLRCSIGLVVVSHGSSL